MKKLVIAVVWSAMLSGVAVLAWTTLSQDTLPVAVGDSILSIPACSFNELVDGYDFFREAILYFETNGGYFYAPVNLPNGSVVKKVILICYDNNASGNIQLELVRISQSASSATIASVLSFGNVAGYRTFAQKVTSKKYVNTWKFSYCLRVIFMGTNSDGYQFSQAKIVYTPPSP